MGLDQLINRAERLVIFEDSGEAAFEASFDAWAMGVLGSLIDPAYESGSRVLLDRRRAGSPDHRQFSHDVLAFVDRYGPRLRGTRWAIVVADEPAAYGSARALSIRASTHGVAMEAFTELDGALWWLSREAA